MSNAAHQIVKLLELSRQQRQQFKALSPEQKRKVAMKDLKQLGIITKSGTLARAFR